MAKTALLLMVALCVAGCGIGIRQELPTPRPLITVTPLSTPLAYPPTPFPVGSEENPLRWVMVPSDNDAAQSAVTELQTALGDALGVTVEVELVDTMGAVIERICESTLDEVTMGTLDALGYAIVNARGCASAAMRLIDDTAVGDEILIVTRQAESLGSARELNLPFCRISSTDVDSWIIPTLMLRTLRLEETTLGQPLDRRTYQESLRTLTGGGCWGTALPARVYNPLRAEESPLVADMRVLERSARLPFGVLMMPPQVSIELRDNVVAFLEANTGFETEVETTPEAETTADAEATAEPSDGGNRFALLMQPFIGSYQFAAIDGNDLALADRFFTNTQLDFALLGG